MHQDWIQEPSWWQTVAAFAQVVLTAMLCWITRRYVQLTDRLLRAQIDPAIQILQDMAFLGLGLSPKLTVENVGKVGVVNAAIGCRLYSVAPGAIPFPGLTPGLVQQEELGELEPGDRKVFDFTRCFDSAVDVVKWSREAHVDSPRRHQLVFEFRHQRKTDLRKYTRTFSLVVDLDIHGKPFMVDAALFAHREGIFLRE